MSVEKIVEPMDLLGVWQMTRTIDDRLADELSTLDGTSELVLQADGRVRWTDTGTLRRGDLDLPVSRVSFVEPRDGGWWVTFDDGRDFHPWSPGDEVVHACAPDMCTGRVEFWNDRWSIEWRVAGPSKDYTMISTMSGRAVG